jgi:hypothetical protein
VRREHGLQQAGLGLILIDQHLVQIGHAAGRVAGAHHVLLPQGVGLALVVARVAGQQRARTDLAAHAHQRTPLRIRGRHVQPHHHRLCNEGLALALGRMAGVHMAHLMTQQRGQLGFVVHLGEDAARHAHGPGRKGVGVDVVGVEHPVGIRHLRPVGVLLQAAAHRDHVVVDPGILDGPEILRELVGRHLGIGLALLGLAHAHHDGFAGDRRRGAALQPGQHDHAGAGAEEPQGVAAAQSVALELVGQGGGMHGVSFRWAKGTPIVGSRHAASIPA